MIRPLAFFVAPLLIGACGDISRIDTADSTPTTATHPVNGVGIAPASRAATSPSSPIYTADDPYAPLDGAIQSQVWRMQQQQTTIAHIPPTESVPRDQVDQLRQQRMQAEALARSGNVPRPVLGRGSGNPVFAYPAPAMQPQLNQAITRARAAEASALTR